MVRTQGITVWSAALDAMPQRAPGQWGSVSVCRGVIFNGQPFSHSINLEMLSDSEVSYFLAIRSKVLHIVLPSSTLK